MTAELEGLGHCTQAHELLGSREGVEAEVEDVHRLNGKAEGEDNDGDRAVQADRENLQTQKPNGPSLLEAAGLGSGIEQTVRR